MLSGLMSRWTIPAACASPSAAQTCAMMCRARRGDRTPRIMSWLSGFPVSSSMTRWGMRAGGRGDGIVMQG